MYAYHILLALGHPADRARGRAPARAARARARDAEPLVRDLHWRVRGLLRLVARDLLAHGPLAVLLPEPCGPAWALRIQGAAQNTKQCNSFNKCSFVYRI